MTVVNEAFAVLDYETTGLDPHEGQILEVAVQVTDLDMNPQGPPFERVLYYSERNAKLLYESSHERVQEMHDKNGLWSELQQGRLLGEVEMELEAHLDSVIPHGAKWILAGNTISFDRAWMKVHMPTLDRRFFYQMFDVTSLARPLSAWTGTDDYVKQYAHRAMDDVTETIAQARYWMSEIKHRQTAAEREL